MSKGRELLVNALLSLFTFAVCALLIEAAAAVLSPSKPKEVIESIGDGFEVEPALWTVLKRNASFDNYKVFRNGSVIYNYTARTDEYRRRTVGQQYLPNNSHILLLGCSCVYGSGLADNETLQYKLGERLPGYNVYNYGVPGYGPQHMLSLFESGRLPGEVSSDRGFAVYVFIEGHLDRAVVSSRWLLYNGPYYYLDGGGLLRNGGLFQTGCPVRSYVYQRLWGLEDKSDFFRALGFSLPLYISSDDVRLTYEIILESKRLYGRQFNGTFFVLVHPIHWHPYPGQTQLLLRMLSDSNVTIVSYPRNYSDDERIFGDGHPSGRLNDFIARNLADTIGNMSAGG